MAMCISIMKVFTQWKVAGKHTLGGGIHLWRIILCIAFWLSERVIWDKNAAKLLNNLNRMKISQFHVPGSSCCRKSNFSWFGANKDVFGDMQWGWSYSVEWSEVNIWYNERAQEGKKWLFVFLLICNLLQNVSTWPWHKAFNCTCTWHVLTFHLCTLSLADFALWCHTRPLWILMNLKIVESILALTSFSVVNSVDS